jgi:hypothetical protein
MGPAPGKKLIVTQRTPFGMALVLPLVGLSLAGCSSTLPSELAPPPAFDRATLQGLAGGPIDPQALDPRPLDQEAFAKRDARGPRSSGYDAEGDFARPPAQDELDAEGRFVPFDRRLPPAAPIPHYPAPINPKQLGRLLDERPTLHALGRLACVEVAGVREYVAIGSWGKHSYSSDDATWQVRPAQPTVLNVVRRALGASPIPEHEKDAWPRPSVLPTQLPFASIVAVPSMLLPRSGDLMRLRLAGARVGAEAILVLVRSTRVYRYHNAAANLYPLLVGLLLPARSEVAVSRVEAAIVGVRSGHVYAVATGDTRMEETGFLLLRNREDSRRMAEEAEAAATLLMAADLNREMASLEAQGRLLARAPAKVKPR